MLHSESSVTSKAEKIQPILHLLRKFNKISIKGLSLYLIQVDEILNLIQAKIQ